MKLLRALGFNFLIDISYMRHGYSCKCWRCSWVTRYFEKKGSEILLGKPRA